jgi:hypothetical protein
MTIPTDPVAAIDWLLDPMAADRRFQWHVYTVLRMARDALVASTQQCTMVCIATRAAPKSSEPESTLVCDAIHTTPPSERDAADAARYRWLRGMIYDDRIIVAPDSMLCGPALDAAIDAAMQGEP